MSYNHKDIVLAMAKKYPALLQGVNDDARREFTRRVAQTLKAKYPAEGWAHKSASPNRPPSKDAIVDKDMRYYDILTASGSASPIPGWHEGDLIPDQHRIEVPAQDWLADSPPPDPPDPQPDLSSIVQILAAQDERIAQQASKLTALAEFDAKLAQQVALLEGRLAALEAAPAKPCTCQPREVRTSQSMWHSHAVTTCSGPQEVVK